MSNFITDVEQQYEVYCKIAEDYGFIDFNAKKNGFRCTTKSNEFNAGWVAFTGAVSAMRDDKQSEINQLKEMNQRYIGKMQEQQDQIAELKAQGEKIQKQFNFLLDKNIRDESAHASLKLRVMSVSHLMDKAAENGTECVDIGSLYDALIKDGDLDQSLRGEHATK